MLTRFKSRRQMVEARPKKSQFKRQRIEIDTGWLSFIFRGYEKPKKDYGHSHSRKGSSHI